MKIAFFTYPAAFQNIGGGEIVMLKLGEYLRRLGVQVDFFDTWNAKIEDYQVLHIFGSVKDCLGLAQVARARKVPVAITPILWSDFRRAVFSDGSARAKLDLLLRHALKAVFPSFSSSRRRLLKASDILLPNSEMEKKHIRRFFAIAPQKMHVIYNGVDRSFAEADPSLFLEKFGRQPFLLSVGRIEPRKNQLNLIRAVKRLGHPRLILIGSPVSGYEDYFEKCRQAGGSAVQFVPTIAHENPLLKSAYAGCELFVQPGWFETPGLSALEASLAGAKVLATSGGSTREYFGSLVRYLNPASPADMAQKISEALDAPRSKTLKDHVLGQFTWEAVAKAHDAIYRKLSARGLRP